MPRKSCRREGKPGYKWGDEGFCYTYTSGDEESREEANDNHRNTLEDSIERSLKVHPFGVYDYSMVEYEGSNTLVTIKCRLHGDFQQNPQHICKVSDAIVAPPEVIIQRVVDIFI